MSTVLAIFRQTIDSNKSCHFSPGVFCIFLVSSLLIFSPSTHGQEGWTTLFSDDFEDGNANGWDLPDTWQVEQDNGNTILQGSTHSFANLETGNDWTNYRLSLRVNIIRQGLHINVRVNDEGRYFIGIGEDDLYLAKSFWANPDAEDLAQSNFPIALNEWHTVAVTINNSHIVVNVDGVNRIDYTDNDNPHMQGRFSLESIWDDDALIYVDDIEVFGPLPPTPTPLPTPLPIPSDWTVVFEDDFPSPWTKKWSLDGEWSVVSEGDNYVLQGINHYWASPYADGWVNHIIQSKIKLESGGIHFNFRISEKRINETTVSNTRYFLGIRENYMYLSKQIGSDYYDLTNSSSVVFPTGVWHDLRIVVQKSTIAVYVNNGLVLEYNDTTEPLLYGKFGLEALDDTTVSIDDFKVYSTTPPKSPEGYVWYKTGGPSGGLGYDVRIHPQNKNIMFVTDNPSGVNKSIDGGETWAQKNQGITVKTGPSNDGIPIFSLTIDPSNPQIVWAGTQDSKGIFKSTDGGETWTKKDDGVAEGNEISFRGFGVHPSNSNIVFAGAEIATGILGIEFGKTKGKIYKTEDGGENWRSVWEGGNLARFVLIDPVNPNVMYGSTGIFDREANNDIGVGILKSIDGGETWNESNNGIPATEGNFFAGFLEMHPENPQILFAASGNNAKGEGGIFRTLDGAARWEKVLANDVFTVVTFSPSDPDVVYAGSASAFYRSDDGGDHWQRYFKTDSWNWGPSGVRAGFPISAVVDPGNPMVIFANNYNGGNFKSTDGAQTWINASNGYTGADLFNVVTDKANPSTVYAIGRSGPFRSTDSGNHWSGIAFPPALQPEWIEVAIHPERPQEILTADEFGGQIFKTVDGGDQWKQVFKHPQVTGGDPQESRHGFKAITYAPSNPNIVYAGMRKGRRSIDGDFPARPSFGMYKSKDAGESWSEINNGLETSLINIHCIAVHPDNPDIAYTGTWRDGIFKTLNGGQSWQAANVGLTAMEVRSIAIDSNNPDIMYAGLGQGGGIFKSTNAGDSWGEINNGVDIVCPSYLLPIGRSKEMVSLDPPAIKMVGQDYYSVPWTSVHDIAIDPTDSQTLFAADFQSGVYLSTDAGCSWSPINEGLTMRAVRALDISGDGNTLYAATSGEGVFRLVKPGAEQTPTLPVSTPTFPYTPTQTPVSIPTITPSHTFTPTPTEIPTTPPSILTPTIVPSEEQSIYIFDNAGDTTGDLTGSTDFDPVDNRNITIAWSADQGNATDWHVYVRKGFGGMKYLGRTKNGTATSLDWYSGADNLDDSFANGPDFNSAYTFRVVRVDGQLSPDDYFDMTVPVGYNLEGGNAVSLAQPELPNLNPGQVAIYDDILGGNDLAPMGSTGSDSDSSSSRAIQIAWNFGRAAEEVNEYHILVSVDGGNFDFLGQTYTSGLNYFWWTPNQPFRTNPVYAEGPQDGHRYQFIVALSPLKGDKASLKSGTLQYSVID